jgi:hypothetical protein
MRWGARQEIEWVKGRDRGAGPHEDRPPEHSGAPAGGFE